MRRNTGFLSIDELKEMLTLDKLDLPADTIVRGIEIEEYQSWADDEEMLRAYLILADDAPEVGLNAPTDPIFEKVRDIVQAAGDPRFVLTTVGTRAEYEARYSFDPYAD